jgi:HrpA-like RNA helicase
VEDPSRAAELPIVAHRSEILSLLEKNQVMIVTGETGSGKTTQVPQFILSRWPEANMIVTQPRRIAATSIAKRVAGEMRAGAVGGLVGYQIGMKSELSASTRLLFCTTGILLRRLVTNKEKSAAEFT